MAEGFRDPKSQGDTWGNNELLTPTQMNSVANNQRHFALAPWLNLQSITLDPVAPTAVACFLWDPTVGNPEHVWLSNGSGDVANVGLAAEWMPNFTDTAHGQSTTNINGITAVAARPMDRAFFGLNKAGATSIGYLKLDASGAWTTIARGAGASTDAAQVRSMAYSPALNHIIASWSDGWIERNISGSDAWARYNVGVQFYDLQWGNGRWVGVQGGTVSTVHTSSDSATWSTTALPASVSNPRLSFDHGTDTWYLLSSDASGATVKLYASTSPGSSWTAVPSTVNPAEAGYEFRALAAHGGTLAAFSRGIMYVTRDLGQTWIAYKLIQSAGNQVAAHGAKFAGGRLFIIGDTVSAGEVFVSQPAFPPYPTVP